MMKPEITYVDLFSGLGAFAKGIQDAGFILKNHYFSEIDKYAIANYKYNFKKANYVGKIQEIETEKIERPDILTFGSPCQDISTAGKRGGIFGKRSKLFFNAVEIINRLRPKIFVFENVKGLLFNNKGKDFEIVLREIANLGLYECQWQLVNTAWILPQNRERIFLVGSLREISIPRIFPLNKEYEKDQVRRPRIRTLGRYSDYRQDIIYSTKGCAPAITVGKGTPTSFFKSGKGYRKLTPVECERLQGLPDNWTKFGQFENEIKPLSNTQRYTLLGNAITSTIMTQITENLKPIFSAGLDGPRKLKSTKKDITRISEIQISYKQNRMIEYETIRNSDDVAEIVRSIISKEKIEVREQMIVLYFNRSNKIIGYHIHSIGGVSRLVTDNKIFLSIALKTLATSMVISHNHPSGNTNPSEADRGVTKRLEDAAKLHDIVLLDHVIVTANSHYSLADNGLMGVESPYPINEKNTTVIGEAETNKDSFSALEHIENLKNYLNQK